MTKRPKYEIKLFSFREVPKSMSGRPKIKEDALVARGVEGVRSGKYKSFQHAARELQEYASKHTGGRDTKINRLARKISKAYKTPTD